MIKSVKRLLLFFAVVSSFSLSAQRPAKPNAAEIQLMLEKLNVLGSALYVAAHPDDENTRVINYLAMEKHFNTAYLSATRGDGGQNLVGPEMRELLGVIRTQELLAARRIDGGKQYFSRANDFGYSKNPEETLEIWNEEQVLADFVRAFRKHRPDVIITRFPEDGGGGHGHHTASAILAGEAFQLSNDKKAYPELAEKYGTWQPTRLVFNTHPWFFSRRGLEMDTSKFLTADLGTYNPLLGKSYTEIASESRSMHKSQGFGSTGTRGTSIEYFEFKYGEEPKNDLFEGIDTSWNRVKGGKSVAYHVENALMNYDPRNPSVIVSDLVKAYNELEKVKDEYWKSIKQKEIKDIIKAATGLYLEIKSDQYAYTPGDSIQLSIESINRSDADITLAAIDIKGLQSFQIGQKLFNNRPYNADKVYQLRKDLPYSNPYWLVEKGTLGMYKVMDENLIGTPENSPALSASVSIKIGETFLDYKIPIVYKENYPVKGEVYRPIEITPPVMVNISEGVYVFGNGKEKKVDVKVIAGRGNVQGDVKLLAPEGWRIEPVSMSYQLEIKEEERIFSFTVYPPKSQSEGDLKAQVTLDGKEFDRSLIRIEYDHIPVQTLFPEATAKVVKIDLNKKGENIGYIHGAGDEIPASLEQVGYNVTELDVEEITVENLNQYDAVILGVRAFNTLDKLKFKKDKLMEYVKGGGTVIVQFNTAHRLVTPNLGPFEIKLSRDRVSVEEAEVRVLKPDHPVINQPNKISQADFDGWVQERGLYFPNEWDEKYEAILSANDPGEEARDGGLLVAEYGEGYYIYTGYSWFRQLPAGVPGAYRIYTNMISIGK